MNTIDHWTTIALIAVALLVTVPLADRALGVGSGAATHATGALATLSLTIQPGLAAGALVVPWLVHVSTRFANSLWALHRHRSVLRAGHVVVAGWLAMAALWLIAHRLDLEPLGFDRVTTLLTVAHFHHAGFGLAALLVATLSHRPADRWLIGAIGLHQIGMSTVAAGITLGSATETTWTRTAWLEPIGAALIIMTLVIWTAATQQLARRRHTSLAARGFLTVAAVAWTAPMALALGWALGPLLPQPVVTTFRVMLGFHASIQAIGLVVCGLAGLVLLGPSGDRIAHRTARHAQPHDDHQNQDGADHAVDATTNR